MILKDLYEIYPNMLLILLSAILFYTIINQMLKVLLINGFFIFLKLSQYLASLYCNCCKLYKIQREKSFLSNIEILDFNCTIEIFVH